MPLLSQICVGKVAGKAREAAEGLKNTGIQRQEVQPETFVLTESSSLIKIAS